MPNKSHQGTLTITRFVGIALKLEKVWPNFVESQSVYSSVLSVATDDRKQFQCLDIVFYEITKIVRAF